MMMADYLEKLLSKQRWEQVINNNDRLIYAEITDRTKCIEVVKKHDTLIEVSIPLKNSHVQYRTTFASEMPAYEYIEYYVNEC
jgi:hypothetical protein